MRFLNKIARVVEALHTHTHTHDIFSKKGGSLFITSFFYYGAKEEVESY